MKSQDERTWAAFCHLSSLTWILLIPLALLGLPTLPFFNLFGPLIVWLTGRDRATFIDRHGRESLNFQLSLTIYSFIIFLVVLAIAVVLLAVTALYGSQGESEAGTAVMSGGLMALVGGTIWLVIQAILSLFGLVLAIWAAIAAGNGRHYRYPLTIQLIPPPRQD